MRKYCAQHHWHFFKYLDCCLQVIAAVQDVRGELHLRAQSILFGPDSTTWIRDKVAPERLNDACSSSTSSRILGSGTAAVQKSSSSWQVHYHLLLKTPALVAGFQLCLMGGCTPFEVHNVCRQELWDMDSCCSPVSLGMACQAGQLHVHPTLGLAVVQYTGTGHWDKVRSVPIGRLSAADADAAQRLLSVSVLRFCWPLTAGTLAPLHSSLQFWAGQGKR